MEKWVKKSENHEIWANFDPGKFLWESSQNFQTSNGYSFSGPIARKSLDHVQTLRRWKKFAPQIYFWEGGPPWGTSVRHRDLLPLVKILSDCDPWPLSKTGLILKFTNFDPSPQIYLGNPEILKPVLYTPLQGQLMRKVWTTSPTLGHNVGVLGPQILMGVAPQVLDQISEITPISDLLSYKGCLSVERPQTLGGRRKKKERNFCWKIQYLRSHYTCGRRYNAFRIMIALFITGCAVAAAQC